MIRHRRRMLRGRSFWVRSRRVAGYVAFGAMVLGLKKQGSLS